MNHPIRSLSTGPLVPLFIACCWSWTSAAHAAPWSQAYAVEWFEPAFYFGAKNTKAADAPGTDCPKGINPQLDNKQLLLDAGYPLDQIDNVLSPDNQTGVRRKWLSERGPNKENIYQHPNAWPDPGFVVVGGNIAWGFDLDGSRKTGFTSPAGERGVDNAFYKVGGCTLRWRGQPRDAYYHKYANDGMRDGDFTMVAVLSGNGDPLNDADARLGFYTSKDKLVKDANGNIARDYSFRIDADPRFQSVVAVRVINGVIEAAAPVAITMHDYMGDSRIGGQLRLMRAKLKLQTTKDGALTGLLGGYMSWERLHRENNDYIREVTGHMSAAGLWYALQRYADGIPDAKTGKNTAISIAYRLDAIPAFAITPDGNERVSAARIFEPDAAKQAAIAAEEARTRERQRQRLNATARQAGGNQ
jgi:hypothetical protein